MAGSIRDIGDDDSESRPTLEFDALPCTGQSPQVLTKASPDLSLMSKFRKCLKLSETRGLVGDQAFNVPPRGKLLSILQICKRER